MDKLVNAIRDNREVKKLCADSTNPRELVAGGEYLALKVASPAKLVPAGEKN